MYHIFEQQNSCDIMHLGRIVSFRYIIGKTCINVINNNNNNNSMPNIGGGAVHRGIR
jgi:hypothetical protein